jgi:hypothetical protein
MDPARFLDEDIQRPRIRADVDSSYSLPQAYPDLPMTENGFDLREGGLPGSHDLGASNQDNGNSSFFNFESNAYGLPMNFGIEETADLDLLQFLASDTSIAFAHT